MAQKVVLTLEGLKKLEKELEHLKTTRRREVAARIKDAKAFGDITDNSEYEDAKNEQAFVEGRIAQLEAMLRNAEIIDEDELDTDTVRLGSKVRLKDLAGGEVFEYVIVGSAEADPANFRISNESPVGKAILGKPAGSIVDVFAPVGTLKFQVLEISR
ncbi:MAG: transcription elongation factor GreA [Firmicutes bacterium]|nr:transcription elongation factor GreA [Bacillota bacterium]HXL03547.1 transcription elongation factor GreA [Bacillota bacterium]